MSNRSLDPTTLRPIPGMEGYSITPHGDIYSHKRRRWLPTIKSPHGYHIRTFSPYGQYLIHHLVLLTFVGPRPAPPNHIGLHLDDNKDNNYVSNLTWGSHQQNAQLSVLTGRSPEGPYVKNARFTEEQVRDIRKRRSQGQTINSLAYHYKVWPTKIADIVHRRSYKNVTD